MLTKYSPKLLVLLLGLLIGGGIIAAKAPAVPRAYDYVSVVSTGNELRISSGADKFDIVATKPTGKNRDYNLTPFLGKLTELEMQGYELVNSNGFTSAGTAEFPRVYALLRRPK
ncbi:MAG: hypothetical protein JWP58_3149 [Hymenobacter sp.]|nr:hypothetical protein [Hymenobacter sp.]